MSDMQRLTNLLVDMDEDGVLEAVERVLKDGAEAQGILEALTLGMNVVGEKYGAKEYFLADLVMAAEIF